MNGYSASPARLGVRPAPELVQRLLVGAFGWMFAGLLLTAATAALVTTSPTLMDTVGSNWFLLLIGQVFLAIGIQAGINKLAPTVGLVLFFVYAATMGLTIGVIVAYYTPESVAAAFVSTAAMFGGASLYGALTKRDLSGMSGLFAMGLIGLIVASLVNIFLHSSPLGWLISIVGVVLFVALTAFDVQRIVRGDYAAITTSAERASVLAALHLYLDAINLFLFLLRIFGSGRN